MPDPKYGNPMKITRITIKGSSGYCPVDVAFHDRVSLTPHSIEYTYKPYYQSEMNRPRRILVTGTVKETLQYYENIEYSGAAEPPFRWRVSQVSGRN